MSKQSLIDLFSSEAQLSRHLRAKTLGLLYWSKRGGSGEEAQLSQIAGILSRFSANQQTVFESGGVQGASVGNISLMERKVQRAISQVMGRATSSPETFVSALNSAFPTVEAPNGTSSFLTGTVSLTPGDLASSTNGSIPVEQANLYRQASVMANDALSILKNIEPFTPESDQDCVEALRSLITTEIKMMVEELGRIDGPRHGRVNAYFDALLGGNITYRNGSPQSTKTSSSINGHIARFGEVTGLNQRYSPTTLSDENYLANFELLKNYMVTLRDIWQKYDAPGPSNRMTLYSDRLTKARTLLSVIVEGNHNLVSALDSVGFSENERRSDASRFTTLDVTNSSLDNHFPDMTVYDLNEWIDRYASLEAPPILAEAGQYGLDFVTYQADRLFWTMVPIAAFIKTTDPSNTFNKPFLAQIFLQERVGWAFDELMNQLNALADLAA
jgi:hypothetical protein